MQILYLGSQIALVDGWGHETGKGRKPVKGALLTGHHYGTLAPILLENSGSQRRCFQVFPAEYEGAGTHTYQLPSVLGGAGAGANALVLPLYLV